MAALSFLEHHRISPALDVIAVGHAVFGIDDE
jgi:hypothetical protein